jgi:hypothetical protein
MTKHPTPWSWDWIRPHGSVSLQCRIADAEGHLVPITFTEYESKDKEALAKLIVRAVNAEAAKKTVKRAKSRK